MKLKDLVGAIFDGEVPLVGIGAAQHHLVEQRERLYRETRALIDSGGSLHSLAWLIRETPHGVEARVVTDDEIAARYPAWMVEEMRAIRGKPRSRVAAILEAGDRVDFRMVKLHAIGTPSQQT